VLEFASRNLEAKDRCCPQCDSDTLGGWPSYLLSPMMEGGLLERAPTLCGIADLIDGSGKDRCAWAMTWSYKKRAYHRPSF
jgi:hypothetical protein